MIAIICHNSSWIIFFINMLFTGDGIEKIGTSPGQKMDPFSPKKMMDETNYWEELNVQKLRKRLNFSLQTEKKGVVDQRIFVNLGESHVFALGYPILLWLICCGWTWQCGNPSCQWNRPCEKKIPLKWWIKWCCTPWLLLTSPNCSYKTTIFGWLELRFWPINSHFSWYHISSHASIGKIPIFFRSQKIDGFSIPPIQLASDPYAQEDEDHRRQVPPKLRQISIKVVDFSWAVLIKSGSFITSN